MKKVIIFLAIVSLFAGVACSKVEKPKATEGYESVNVNISVYGPEADTSTKAIKSAWVNGDILNIWFDYNKSFNPDLTLTYNGSTWEASKVSTTVLDALNATGGTLKVLWEGNNDLSGCYEENITYGGDIEFVLKSTSPSARVLANVGISYTYESASKTITASITDLHDYTAFQVTVPGLAGEGWYINSESMHPLNNMTLSNAAWQYGTWYANKEILGKSVAGGYEFYAGEIKSDYFDSPHIYTFTLTNGLNKYKYTTPASHEVSLNRGTRYAYPFMAITLPTFDGEAATPVNWIKQ